MGNCCTSSTTLTVDLDTIIKYRKVNAKQDDDVNIDFVLDPKLVKNHICAVSKQIESLDVFYRSQIFELLCQCGALRFFSRVIDFLKQSFILFKSNIDQNKLSTESQINLVCCGYILCNIYTLREYFTTLLLNDTPNLAHNSCKIKRYLSNYSHQLRYPNKKISNYFKFFIENDDDNYYDNYNYCDTDTVQSIANKQDESKLICFEMMDILRNLLFQIGVIWYFCLMLNALTVYRPLPSIERYFAAFQHGLYVDFTHSNMYNTIRRANNSVNGLYHVYDVYELFLKYLDMKLIDSAIVWNGTFLYQVFTKLELKPFLLELLINNDNEWSIMTDEYNQVKLCYLCYRFRENCIYHHGHEIKESKKCQYK